MTDKLIRCPECLSDNLDNSVYCCQCGSPMRKGIPARIRKSQWATILGIALILSVIMTAALHFFTSRQDAPPSTEIQQQPSRSETPVKQDSKPVTHPAKTARSSDGSKEAAEKKQAEKTEGLTVGSVSILNPNGVVVGKFTAAVVGGSWLALPTRACIGGNKWFFTVGDDAAIPIEGGLWGAGDAVGFWKLAGEKKFKGPGFDTWNQELPVRLLSLETGSLSAPLNLTPSGVVGDFIYCPLPAQTGPGVFLQNDNVVGWSFGDILGGAYMWTLGQDTNLLYKNYVDDFYNLTFAGGREEYFFTALAKGSESSPQRQLQMFAEAFWAQPKLSPEDTPRYLSTETVYPYIAKLVNFIMDQGAYQYITPLADEPMLREMKDPELFANVVTAIQKNFGIDSALNFIEGPGTDIVRSMEDKKGALAKLHLDLYLGWIKDLLDSGAIERAWEVYNRARSPFSESPELNLLAVELHLADGNWAEAERLLYRREYPPALRETWMRLADRISDLKGQENKIVIKFQPGSKDISVNATLNDRLAHDFLVDTGSTFVTVPYATIEALGLEENMSTHQTEVQTAGGMVKAYSVILSSIELQGWVVSDIKALVLDLPDRPGLGLLGLNFLDSFRLDLQTEEGILTLEPK